MLNLSSSGSRGRAGHRRPRGAWLSVLAGAGMLALAVPAASAASRAGGLAAGSAAQATPAQTTRQYVIWSWPRAISYAQQVGTIAAHGADQLLGAANITPTFRGSSPSTTTRSIPRDGWILGRPGHPDRPAHHRDVTRCRWQTSWATPYRRTSRPIGRGPTRWPRRDAGERFPPASPRSAAPTRSRSSTSGPTSTSNNVNMIPEATAFRANVRMTTLAKYEADHNAGAHRSSHPGHSPSASRRRKIAAATLTPNAFLR